MNSSRYISFSSRLLFIRSSVVSSLPLLLLPKVLIFMAMIPHHTTTLSCPNLGISFTASSLHLHMYAYTLTPVFVWFVHPASAWRKCTSVCKSARPGRERKCRRACGTSLLAMEFSCGTRKLEWKVAVLLYLRRCEKHGMWELSKTAYRNVVHLL